MTIEPQDFDYLSQLIQERSGLVLTEDKHYLLESRLLPIIRRLKLDSITALVADLKRNPLPETLVEITEAMTTNETSFFRDAKPFEQFRQITLPHLVKHAKNKKIRIWSAACSTGQEPYSLAMCILEEAAKLGDVEVEIVATDLANHVLRKAEDGVYTQFEVQRGLPVLLMVKYFEQRGDKWRVRENVRSLVSYKQANLLEDVSGLGQFDMVFCRNVLIYFDVPTKAKVLANIHKQMLPHAVLSVGSAETLYGITEKFKAASPDEKHRGLYLRQEYTGSL
jgi:chemotaxis protein methyltransferase CheR